MDMKAKLKTPEIAQKKGKAHVKATLKKLFKESITEKTYFFYDSEFDYGQDPKTGANVVEPILYIGEIPSAWKKWIKSNNCKTSKTFALGECLFDAQTKILKLKVQIGKGAKNPILKVIMKELCKPFAKPGFVESLDSDVVEVMDDDTAATDSGAAGETASTEQSAEGEGKKLSEAQKAKIKENVAKISARLEKIAKALKIE